MSEGSLEAPVRRAIAWKDPAYYDETTLDEELRRVFDICHGCRRCFNLCDSFPLLFDLIDEAETGELDSVDSAGFKPVIDACTLCDMCFMTKCPYVPPHEFDLDFPHLMLRARAIDHRKGATGFADRQLAKTDRNGQIGCRTSGIANWASRRGNALTRPVLQALAGIDKNAELPQFAAQTFEKQAVSQPLQVNEKAAGFGRKAALYTTCYGNYNTPQIAGAARAVLAKNGVETIIAYPGCCGMPQLEQGDIASVAEAAKTVAANLRLLIDQGHDIIAMVPSCALMMKFEWPLIVPDDDNVKRLSEAVRDTAEYLVMLEKDGGLADGLSPLDGDITVHIACHARAQNMGQKAAEMLRLIPDTQVTVIERCSGHGGSWGIKKGNFDTALKVGKPVARQALKAASPYVVSECPLAREHILQGMEQLDGDVGSVKSAIHPIELIARAYGL